MRHLGAAVAVLAGVAALATACGGTGALSADAGPGGDGPAEASAPSCDPAAQNCGASALKCDFSCMEGTAVVACIPNTGDGGIGSTCAPAMPCARGTACVTMATTGSLCLKYCAGDGDCATGERCHNDTVGVGCGGPATSLALHFCY